MASEMKPWEHPDFDDNPEWTAEDFARARPASEVFLPEIVAQLVRKPGRPALPPGARKKSVGIRLAPDLLAAMKATGRGWQGRAEDVLRKAFVKKSA